MKEAGQEGAIDKGFSPAASLLATGDRWLLDRLPSLVAELDPDGTILFVNAAIAAITGFRPEEVLGQNWWDVFCPRALSRRAAQLRDQLRDGDLSGQEMVLIARNGSSLFFELNTANSYGPAGLERVILIAQNITPRRRAEEAWREGKYTLERRIEERTTALAQAREAAEARAREAEEARRERERLLTELDSTFTAIADAVVIFGPAGEILRLNPAAQSLLGYTPEEMELPLPERARVLELEAAGGQALAADEWPLAKALRGETTRGQILLVRRGERCTCVSASAAPLYGDQGRLFGAVVSFTDITALKELEEQQELYLHTISHDLRVPLTILSGHAQLLQEEVEQHALEEAMGESLRIILQGIERMNSMIQDLVDAARLAGGRLHLQPEEIDLDQFLEEMLHRASLALEVARVEKEIGPGIPAVCADPARLERILLNLLSNALKYSQPPAPVRLRIENGGAEVLFTVADQGTGIPAADLPRIFDRFYKGREQRQADSVGLGLYITRTMVEAHGGRLWAESEVGRGSTFSFTLPVVSASTPVD